MGILSILQFFLFVIISYLIYNTYRKYKKIHENELKGPKFVLPVLGNLHQLSELPHRDLTKMGEKYGHIFRVWFSDVYTVVVSDPVLIREMLVENIDTFLNRPNIPSFEYGVYFHGTVSSQDDNWRRNRDIVSRALRKTNIKHIYELLDNQVNILIDTMKQLENNGEVFDPRYYMTRYTMSAMYKYIFNEDVQLDQDVKTGEIAQFMKILNDIFIEFGAGSLFDLLHITQPFYLKWLELTDKNYPKFLKLIDDKLNNHFKTFNSEISRDFLDVLIKEYGTETKDDMLSIISTVSDMFMAGVETSSTSLEYMICLLCNYPEIQEKVYNEIKTSLNGRDRVLLSDRQSIPYLVAFIKETMRFKIVTPFGLPRSASQDIMIGGHFIPKDSQIIINFHALSMNEQYFENPDIFDPSRFLKQETNLAFLPFSIGARNCVGQNLAQDEMFLAISNSILNFKFSSVDGKKIDETEQYGITLRPKTQFSVRLEKRT